MPGDERIYIVESMEWAEVALVASDGSSVEVVPALRLPRPLRVGTRLRVPLDDGGRPRWPLAVLMGLVGYAELDAVRREAGIRR